MIKIIHNGIYPPIEKVQPSLDFFIVIMQTPCILWTNQYMQRVSLAHNLCA
jgi:hypothetical protein